MPQLLAGAARANLTPYVGAFLAGFGSRDHACEGVHDDLFARALVLQAGETTVAVVSCDLIGLGAASVAAVRERIEAATGIPPAHVMVACTHTHSGPTLGLLRHPGFDPELLHVTEKKVAGAVIAAHRSLRGAALGAGKGTARIGINRRQRLQDGSIRLGRNPEGAVDEEVGVLRIDDGDGRPMALLVVHPCHPVVLAGDNYLVSADYPGQAAGFLERVYPGATCAFLNATGGDINPACFPGTFEDARRLGVLVGSEALQVAEGIACASETALAAKQTVVEAPLAGLPPADEARRLLEERTKELDAKRAAGEIARDLYDVDCVRGWARDVLAEYSRPHRPTTRPLEIQALRLGDALLVGTPGETFVEIGLAIKAASPIPNTFVLGYTNGNVGYIPTARAFEEGGYEVEAAHKFYYGVYAFAPGVEAVVTGAAVALARDLAAS